MRDHQLMYRLPAVENAEREREGRGSLAKKSLFVVLNCGEFEMFALAPLVLTRRPWERNAFFFLRDREREAIRKDINDADDPTSLHSSLQRNLFLVYLMQIRTGGIKKRRERKGFFFRIQAPSVRPSVRSGTFHFKKSKLASAITRIIKLVSLEPSLFSFFTRQLRTLFSYCTYVF